MLTQVRLLLIRSGVHPRACPGFSLPQLGWPQGAGSEAHWPAQARQEQSNVPRGVLQQGQGAGSKGSRCCSSPCPAPHLGAHRQTDQRTWDQAL